MTSTPREASGSVVQQFRRLFGSGTVAGMSEKELLERFVTRGDDVAFEALMTRHGPMVLGVCRQVLRDPNDVDDAFQATFLILVRKAGTLKRSELLGNWLYGVAYRVAMRTRVMAARRTDRVASLGNGAAAMASRSRRDAGPWSSGEPHDFELTPVLHQEVHRLPEKYRIPIVLCYFEGLTHEAAASHLGCPLGTLKGRLTRARGLLERRLVRRGVTASSAILCADLGFEGAFAAVPDCLAQVTLRSAHAVALQGNLSLTTISGVSLPIASLVQGVLRTMMFNQLRTSTLSLILAGTIATGVVVGASQIAEVVNDDPQPESTPKVAATTQKKAGDNRAQRPAAAASGGSNMGAGMMGNTMGGMAGGMAGMNAMGGMMAQPMGGMGGIGGGGMAGMMAQNPEARLRMVRRQIATFSSQLALHDTNPNNKAIYKKLEEPITMSFANETPLDDVLKYIKQVTTGPKSAPIPIYVDPKGLKEAEASLTSAVTLDLDGVPLKTTLRLALKQLNLAYCVRDGVLIISSGPGIAEELMEATTELETADPKVFAGQPDQGLQ